MSEDQDQLREIHSIADELARLVTRRAAEGAPADVIAAGLALGITLISRSSPEGNRLIDAVGDCLTGAINAGREG